MDLQNEKIKLPQAGEKLCGFTVEEVFPFPELGAMVVGMTHEATGARLYWIANDDVNRVFDLTFFTEAVDNTGLPHIFEHATLGGSEKYPSKALFFNLVYQTYNTYMNAATSDIMTTFPVASLSEAQLLRLADVYLDSCLHPSIMTDESIFREEAWRWRMENADAPLTLEGTVYSEMKGALSLRRMANYNVYRVLYPGALCTNISGGDPDFIPTLTWDRVKRYHDNYYHPSNCCAFLYGSFEHPEAFLQLADEAFAPFGKRKTEHARDAEAEASGFRSAEFPFPVEAGSDEKHASSVCYALSCPELAKPEFLLMDALSSLLDENASPLMQRLSEELPSGAFSCGWDNTAPVGTLLFTADSLDRNEAETFRRIVDEEIAKLADAGFPQDLARSLSESISLSTKLMRESPNAGLNAIQSMAYNLAESGDIHYFQSYIAALGHVDRDNAAGLYADLVRRFLLKPAASALVTTYPEPGARERQDAALAERLAQKKASLTEAEREEIIARSQPEEEKDDASALVASVQAVTASSLPEEVKRYEVRSAERDGLKLIDVPCGVDGVGRTELYLNAAVPQESLHYAKLAVDLQPYLDGDTHTKQEIATLAGRYLNNYAADLIVTREGDVCVPRLHVSWTVSDENLEESYAVAREVLFGLNFADPVKLKAGLSSLRMDQKSQITEKPYQIMMTRSIGRTDERCRISSYVNGIEYYAFLKAAEKLLETDPQAVTTQLGAAVSCLKRSGRAVLAFCGNETSLAKNAPCREALAGELTPGGQAVPKYDLPVPAAREGLIIDSTVQYNGIASDLETVGLEFGGEWTAVTSLVTDSFLYPQLRDRYGAYGVLHAARKTSGFYMISYRDPNVARSFEIYEQIPDMLEDLPLEQERLNGYILSQYAGLAMPSGELSGAGQAVMDLVCGRDPLRILTYMRDLKRLTPERVRELVPVYRALIEKGSRFTAGGAAAVRGSGLYDTVLDPFAGETPESDA